MSITAQEVAERIANGGPLLRQGSSFKVLCPNHIDKEPSLSIRTGDINPVLMHCHAGCDTEAVLKSAGLEYSDLFGDDKGVPDYSAYPQIRGEEIDRIYVYRDEAGVPLFEVVRTKGKKFVQRRKDVATGRYEYNLAGVRRVPFRLPEALAAVSRGEVLWITEGEKDVNALYHAGVTATCNPGGAGKWRDEYSEMFAGASVVVVQDLDIPGREHARGVRESLVKYDCHVRIVEPHGELSGKKGADAYDHLILAKHTLDEFVEVPSGETGPQSELAMDVMDFIAQDFGVDEMVIDGTMSRGEIMIVTGFEGHGKSLLLKQIGTCVSGGIHPFTFRQQDAHPVLFIDCENPARNMVKDFSMLTRLASKEQQWESRERMSVIAEGPIDVGDPMTMEWLLSKMRAHKPHLLIIGPLYNMVSRDLGSEDNARVVKNAIDQVKAVSNAAVILEHHIPLAQGGNMREVRPIGSSLLHRWPSYGFGMKPIRSGELYEWQAWRGARQRDRIWPSALQAGGSGNWPWIEGVVE